MPPRSAIDQDENSLRSDCWSTSSTEVVSKGEQPLPETLTTPENNNNSTTRAVRFAPTAKVRQFTKFSRDQAKDIWFVNEDFSKMKKSFAPTVERMMNGTLSAEDEQSEEHCIRGLEYRTKDGARRRMKNKFNGMAAVLHEQDRQIFEEYPDAEKLAQVYKEVNAHCMEDAIALGAQDELDIQEYMSTNTDPEYDGASVTTEKREKSFIKRSFSNGKKERTGKLKSSGSFHERSIRGIKRIFSGKSSRRPQVGAAA